MAVKGTVDHEGRRGCGAVHETTGPHTEYDRVVMCYAEDDSYRTVVCHDEQGDAVNEFEMEGTADG